MASTTKKLTMKDRKNAQPAAVIFFTPEEKTTIANTVARNLTDVQRNIYFYTAQALGLNPLLNEITAISYAGNMSIQVMRDGFLTIAHRSGKFAGLESGVKVSDDGKKILYGWARVYHKDFTVPVYQEADFEEYTTGKNLWATKPKTMIKKVAESMALRKAFNINGVYAPEEMDKELIATTTPVLPDEEANKPATNAQIENIRNMSHYSDMDKDEKEMFETTLEGLTFGEAALKIKELVSK